MHTRKARSGDRTLSCASVRQCSRGADPELKAIEDADVVSAAVKREGFDVPSDQVSMPAAAPASEGDSQVPRVDVRLAADDDATPQQSLGYRGLHPDPNPVLLFVVLRRRVERAEPAVPRIEEEDRSAVRPTGE